MQCRISRRILIDEQKLEILLRLGVKNDIIFDTICGKKNAKTGDKIIDEILESLITKKEFKNWGGARKTAGRKRNQVEKNLKKQDEKQDASHLADKDIDKDNLLLINNIKNISTARAREKKTKPILPVYQEIADYLADNLSVKLNRKISNRGWADEIRKLCEAGNIDPPRVKDALEWHFRKYDRPYRIEIQSARTLREKFSRLETAYMADEPDLPV